MSEQALDLQSVLSTMRRHRRLLGVLTLAGALAGLVMVHLDPPMYSSSTQVLMPAPPPSSTGAGRDSATDIKVALSDLVLGPAGQDNKVSPHLTTGQVRQRVSVTAPTEGVLQIVAKASTGAEAEALAGAVASAEVAFQADTANSLAGIETETLKRQTDALQAQLDDVSKEIKVTAGRMATEAPESKFWHQDATARAALQAQQADLSLKLQELNDQSAPTSSGQLARVIVEPTPAKRSNLVLWTAIWMLVGGLLALGPSTVALSIRRRRDRRLRTRDEVADAVGSAVIGSVRARPQRASAGWSALMKGYEPSVTDAWSLRQALDHVGLGDLMIRAREDVKAGRGVRSRVLTLITLSDDPRGLAVGPQLASHTASLGLRTRLVALQGHESATALWAACSALRRDDEVRPGLRVDTRRRKGDDLTVEIVIVDRRNPQFVSLDGGAVTVLAVASSSATGEDLARTAVAAYEAGGRISGVIVADPDSLDRTTGRMLLQQRAEQPPLPTRMTGLDSTVDRDSSGGGGR